MPGFWRFAALPLIALLAALWVTMKGTRQMPACMGEWEMNRGRFPDPLPVVDAAGKRVALFCVKGQGSYSYIGYVLPENASGETVAADALRRDWTIPALDEESIAELIDEAIAVRFGCKVEGGQVSKRDRLPRIERIGVSEKSVNCD